MNTTLNRLWPTQTGILVLAASLILGAVAGYLFYSIKAATYLEQTENEAQTLQRLTSSYVSEYSQIRREVQSDVPVPAQFRAQAHVRFNSVQNSDDRIKASMVGLPGKSIKTSPTEARLVEQLHELGASDKSTYQPVSGIQTIAGEKIFRSVFPSVANQASCADCHNHLQRGAYRWKQGDLMGAYVIDKNISTPLSQMKIHSTVLAALVSLAFCLGSVVRTQYKKLTNQSVRLQTLANTDSLTNCKNRRSLFAFAEQVHKRDGAAGGLMMIDVDHFKNINDEHGHDIGDQILVHISNILKANIRTDDILARVGGEEFVAYLPGCDKVQSIRIANRICYSVAQQPLKIGAEPLHVTVSVGLVQMRSTKENIFLQWMGAADRLLYKAKNQGRNQVCYLPKAHMLKG